MRAGYSGLMACALLMGALAACGFHLRRPADLPPQMRMIYISGNLGGNNTALLRSLRRDLATGNVQIVDDPTQATAILKIEDVTRSNTLLAISSAGTPLEYKIYYQTQFSLLVGNTMLIEPQTLVLTRTYNYSISNAIGNEEQEEGLYGAMAEDMAQLIAFRIHAVAKSAVQAPVTAAAPARATLQAPPAVTRPPVH